MRYSVLVPTEEAARQLEAFVHTLGGDLLREIDDTDFVPTPEQLERERQFEEHPNFKRAIQVAIDSYKQNGGHSWEEVKANGRKRLGL